jgi:hypothetical protein
MTGIAESVSTASTFDQSVWYWPKSLVTPKSRVFALSSVMKIRGNQRSFQKGTRL